jgi:DNA (cytosine-5)-methyltransferase 1
MPDVEWIWCAEIEKFPSAVLAQRHPGSNNLGDITAPDFIQRALAFGPLDVLVAGTPCQAFSIAGNRGSLDDERGNLTLRFVEIVDAIQPRTVLWENVPGVLSTKDNAFGCFLGALAGSGAALVPNKKQRWTDCGVVDGPKRRVAWRILDAQWFGVAQRRERVFVVASARNESHPAKVLFDSKGMLGNTAPSREAGERTAGTLSARTQGGGGLGTDFEIGGGLVPVEPSVYR